MKWRSLPIVAFDTETTGLTPFSGDRVIEFAAVRTFLTEDGRVGPIEAFSWLVNPGIPIPKTITQITGIRDDDVANAPPFSEIAEQVAELLGGGLAVAHNLPFDHAFLTTEFRIAGVPWREPVASIDTVDLSMRVFSEARSHKLGDLAKRLDVQLTEAHRAANDAAACGMAFVEMARRADVADELQTLLDWAVAIGRPPDEGAISVDAHGLPIFVGGPHAGQLVAEHPLHLAWLDKAREHNAEGWAWRYPEATRRWARRWLQVRTAGRAHQNPKSFHAQDWVIDPCVTVDRKRGMA